MLISTLVPTLDMKCPDEFPYEAHIFYFYDLLCFYILIGACIARHKTGSCKWLLEGRASGWSHGPGYREVGQGRRAGDGEGRVRGALAIQWAATPSTFQCLESILMLRCAISTLLSLYLGTCNLDVVLKNQAKVAWMKNVGLRIDKLLPKIGSSPYLVKKLHTRNSRPQSTARRTDIIPV